MKNIFVLLLSFMMAASTAFFTAERDVKTSNEQLSGKCLSIIEGTAAVPSFDYESEESMLYNMKAINENDIF